MGRISLVAAIPCLHAAHRWSEAVSKNHRRLLDAAIYHDRINLEAISMEATTGDLQTEESSK
jgi:hypothetical protein